MFGSPSPSSVDSDQRFLGRFSSDFSTLCEVSETLTKWKSESMTYLPTYGLTREGGARNTCVSKIEEKIVRNSQSYQTKMTLFDQCALCIMFIDIKNLGKWLDI